MLRFIEYHWPALLIVVLVLTAGGCGQERDAASRPDMVVVVMDTLRRDHMSLYGYQRPTTPFLSQLASRSMVFDQAYSVSCWTPPGHASLFTGLYPLAHGVTQEQWALSDDALTMAEIFQANGYRTLGIAENPMLSTTFRFDQGFDHFHEIWRKANQQQAGERTLEQVRASLLRVRAEQPLFMFINLNGAHKPYNAARQFSGRFTRDRSNPLVSYDRRNYYLGEVAYSEEDHQHLRDLYDAEVLYVDYQLSEIVKALEARDRWEGTVFVVTADHGENFGDHGHVGHTFSLYESTVKIPLLIHFPPRFASGSRDSAPTQIIDLLPTLTGLLGIEGIACQGKDLLQPRERDQRALLCEYYRPKQAFQIYGDDAGHELLQPYNRRLRSVIFNQTKLIWGEDGRHELYRLDDDPAEQANLIASPRHAPARKALLTLLQRTVNTFDPGSSALSGAPEEPLDDETLEAMRTLGYIR